MPDLAIRGVPDDLHRELKAAAERNHRSLNGEIVSRLTASIRPEAIDPVTLLDRIQRRYRTLGPIDLDNLRRRGL